MTSKIKSAANEKVIYIKKENYDNIGTLFFQSSHIRKRNTQKEILLVNKIISPIPVLKHQPSTYHEAPARSNLIKKIRIASLDTINVVMKFFSLIEKNGAVKVNEFLDQLGHKNFPLEKITYHTNSLNTSEYEMKNRSKLISLAKCSIKRTLSKETGAYIHYIKELGPSGIYAASASENLAEKEIIEKISREIMGANANKIAHIESSLDVSSRIYERAKIIDQIKSTSCTGNIGLYTPAALKEKIQKEAQLKKKSINDFVFNLMKSALDDIENIVIHHNEKHVHELFNCKKTENEPPEEKVKWVVRFDKTTHARLIFLAKSENLSTSKAVEKILSSYID